MFSNVIVWVSSRLYQVKMEREQYQNEIRDLQDQLSEMHDELDSAKRAGAEDEEKDALTEVSSSVKICSLRTVSLLSSDFISSKALRLFLL